MTMIIITMNSIYEIKGVSRGFEGQKIEEINKSTYYAVGQVFSFKKLVLAVGESAMFDNIQTSPVKAVKENL